jgi:hypothetical protein
MNVKKIASAVIAAVLAGVVGYTASATPAPAAAHPSLEKTHLMVWSVNSDGAYFTALATGAVGDYGPAVTVLPDGSVDPEHTGQLELNLAKGSFRLSIVQIARDLAQAVEHWSYNQQTCSGGIRFTAPAPVVTGSGTGAYRGIAGGFSITLTSNEVLQRDPSGCALTSRPLSELIVMDATGIVTR